jgi:Uncharacterized N-terminal domain of the transcription elongation factor GreA
LQLIAIGPILSSQELKKIGYFAFMGYLKEFQTRLDSKNLKSAIELWDEYQTVDSVDTKELLSVLQAIKNSTLVKEFGSRVESVFPMWETIQDPQDSYTILKAIIDLQTNNSPALKEACLKQVLARWGSDPQLQEKLKLVGLRGGDNFQGALAAFELLMHMKKNAFVFHTGGWGTGEILDVSFLRQEITVEFENVGDKKTISFQNAFKTLIPLERTHFLARRFGNPDLLEKEAKADPVAIIKLLLKDLGPKNSQEIKDELSELVIPESEWVKWWQSARSKLKKDALIESPENTKAPFKLRNHEKTVQEEFSTIIFTENKPSQYLEMLYAFLRDKSAALKDPQIKEQILSNLKTILSNKENTPAERLQAQFLLTGWLDIQETSPTLQQLIVSAEDPFHILTSIEILALKKQFLIALKEHYGDWESLFTTFLFADISSTLREWLLKTLLGSRAEPALIGNIEAVFKKPSSKPEFFFWYFQKLAQGENIPFQSREGLEKATEAYLLAIHSIENKPQEKELTKKMINFLTAGRWSVVRQILQGSKRTFLEEFLLLASKCHSFSEQDLKILRSLAAVVDPSLNQDDKKRDQDDQIVWTTEASLQKAQERVKHLGTVEIVDNAREIEVARAHGDLRENSEYKFALERRSRIQSELKTLSDQIHKARVITPQDLSDDGIGIGHIVTIEDTVSKDLNTYTILGPWDVDPEKGIISSNSQIAQALLGKQLGDSFSFKDSHYKITAIRSMFDR